jgi:hypothetical protein
LFKIIFRRTPSPSRDYKFPRAAFGELLSDKGKQENAQADSSLPDSLSSDAAAPLPHLQGESARAAELPANAAQLHRTRTAPAVLADDTLYGADQIAEFLYGDSKFRRKVYNLVETKRLPHFRLGACICSRKSVLLEWIVEQEGFGV